MTSRAYKSVWSELFDGYKSSETFHSERWNAEFRRIIFYSISKRSLSLNSSPLSTENSYIIDRIKNHFGTFDCLLPVRSVFVTFILTRYRISWQILACAWGYHWTLNETKRNERSSLLSRTFLSSSRIKGLTYRPHEHAAIKGYF